MKQAPTQSTKRIELLDIYRGFAVFDIFLVNIVIMHSTFLKQEITTNQIITTFTKRWCSMKIILFVISTLLTLSIGAQTVIDIDGNSYNTVVIGAQTWMKENLRVLHFQNGDSIPTTAYANKDISSEVDPIYQWAYDGIDSNAINSGRLYTWHAATDARKICPVNWHIPSGAEWDTLIFNLGGMDNAKAAMLNGTFSALYSGRRNPSGLFRSLTSATYWWSSDTFMMNSYWKPALTSINIRVEVFGNLFRSRSLGFCIRCVKDNSSLGLTNSIPGHNYIRNDYYHTKVIVDAKNIKHPVLHIYTSTGSLVLRKSIEGQINEIDITHLPSGLYIYQLSGNNFLLKEKRIKTK